MKKSSVIAVFLWLRFLKFRLLRFCTANVAVSAVFIKFHV